MRFPRRAPLGGSLLLALGLGACAGPYAELRDEPVVRRFGAQEVTGPYVSPAAYEHYILALLAESAGRSEDAIEAFRRALGSDGSSAYLRWRLADVLLATGRIDEAREELETALQLEPASAEAYVVKARLYARLGERAAVEAALIRAIALDPRLEEAYLSLVAVQREAGREAASLETMRALADRLPSASAEEALGRAALLRRDRKAARTRLQRAVELDPARNDARLELARLALDEGEAEFGLHLLAEAAERMREPTLYLELARTAARFGRVAEAVAVLDRLEEDALSLPGRLAIAAAFVDVGLARRAWLIAEAVLGDEKRAAVRASARVVLARAAEAEGALTEAQQAWQGLGPGDAEYASAVIARARLLGARGRQREARALFEAALAEGALRDRADDREQLVLAFSELRAELGDGDGARAQVEALLVKRPLSLVLRLGLARLERRAGRPTQAIALLEPLARRGEPAALLLLGETYLALGQHLDEAASLLERAEGLAPHDAAIAGSLGALYLATGRLDEAQRLLERAERATPGDVSVLTHLSRLCALRDDPRRAVELLRRALAAHPGEPTREALEAQLLMLERGRVGAR